MALKRSDRHSESRLGHVRHRRSLQLEPLEDRRLLACSGAASEAFCESFETDGDGTVAASDPDAGQTLNYAITSGNTGGAFAIDGSSGQITVANSAPLDFETTPSFDLTVAPYKYSLLRWETSHFLDKWLNKLSDLTPWTTEASREERFGQIREFFDLVKRAAGISAKRRVSKL